jgi:multidrug transporter EmrE-like cation transporter
MLAGATLIATAVFQLPFIVFTSGLALFTLGFGTTFTPLLGLAMTAHPLEAGTASSVIAVSGTIATTLSGSFYAVLDHQSAIGIGITQFSLMILGIILLFAVVRPNQLEVMK